MTDAANEPVGIKPSLPVFLVYNLGLDEAVHNLAMDYVHSTLVPEPLSLITSALAFLAAIASARHAKR